MSFWTQRLSTLALIAAVAGGSFTAGSLMVRELNGSPTQAAPQAIQTSNVEGGEQSAPAQSATVERAVGVLGPNFIADAAEKASPAVVTIDTERKVDAQQERNDSLDKLDPLFREFFGNRLPELPKNYRQRGSGSGFIVSADGTIFTNAHVVEGVDTVKVTLQDGRTFTGKVRGRDPLTDLAVVKIQAPSALPTVEMGSSAKLRPGEWVIALGNPLRLKNTVTAGIVSALARGSDEVGVGDKRVDFIQTDAAINPGNSGGPLINIYGQVVGINTAIIQGASGIGFAIPIDEVRSITDRLIADGKVIRPFIGVQMVTLSPDVLRQLKEEADKSVVLPTLDKGVLVQRVIPKSPAAKGGLIAGDVIVEVDNAQVLTAKDVQERVGTHHVGEKVMFKVQRKAEVKILQLETEELKNQFS
ncbi:MAG: trypsin-like peptidase domain-containing protein [Gloeobacterales cyanobacterium]